MGCTLGEHFRMLARYNRIANERLYRACAALDDGEYRKARDGSFFSVHGTLNHILLGDRVWMARFEGSGRYTPPLAGILFDDFGALREARQREDARIELFMSGLAEEFFAGTIEYVNSEGSARADPAAVAVAHLFNHQTHHRAEVQTMLRQAGVKPPSLDMHRATCP